LPTTGVVADRPTGRQRATPRRIAVLKQGKRTSDDAGG
jgi:hypothetical protein